ncbi:MAG: hypothetical protein E7281_00080 [Lachnospiraceae bacterium]|nr:hypothetical protein [Lachnospiraceae bacterium]
MESWHAMSWDEKDDIQKMLSVMEVDIAEALNYVLEYKYLLRYMDNNGFILNKASNFWGQIMPALRFTLIMKTARIFDESKDAIGFKKIISIFEKSKYGKDAEKELDRIYLKYNSYKEYFSEIRMMRNKVFAHNDSKVYQFWKNEENMTIHRLEFEASIWGHMEEILSWAKESIVILKSSYGDTISLHYRIQDDMGQLFE